jgi:hypothetical protein
VMVAMKFKTVFSSKLQDAINDVGTNITTAITDTGSSGM